MCDNIFLLEMWLETIQGGGKKKHAMVTAVEITVPAALRSVKGPQKAGHRLT